VCVYAHLGGFVSVWIRMCEDATSESKCRWMQDCDSAIVQSVRVMCAAK